MEMYNVMLADDDYPVLELLSESIDWEGLGFHLIGAFENGATAWEHAQEEMPDLLITDIGMPRMNGLELCAKIKEQNQDARIIILSCHDEFSYAQQAMRLKVQDYVLKESLQPEDLARMLERIRKGLDEEKIVSGEQLRLHALVNHSQELRKEQLFKNFIHQPLLTPEKWLEEASGYGIFVGDEACLAAVGHIDDYPTIKHRFAAEETLKFAVANVMQEALRELDLRMQYIPYTERKLLLLISYRPGLKTNIYDKAASGIGIIQATLRRVLKLRSTFILGTECATPEKLKRSLQTLLKDDGQRFYLEAGSLVKYAPESLSEQDIFQYYDAASLDLREAMIGKRPADAC
ncbi:response regulator, partial [Gorillibacterium massiliense]|uniref:response regulator n=1 Tax=Gorillibacterium massiliense TaxID=1280390 RepID=UPI001EE2EB0D